MNDQTYLLKHYAFPSTKLLGASSGKLTLEHRNYQSPSTDELAQLGNIPQDQLLFAASDFDTSPNARTKWLKMATSDIDRVGDSLNLSGIVVDNFILNPQLLWMHGLTQEPVHTIGRIRAIALTGDALYALAEYASAELSPLAGQIAQLESAGFLPANSIGFHPIEWEANDSGGLDFLKWELIECSKVELPMNPYAINDEGMNEASGEDDIAQEFDLQEATEWLAG